MPTVNELLIAIKKSNSKKDNKSYYSELKKKGLTKEVVELLLKKME